MVILAHTKRTSVTGKLTVTRVPLFDLPSPQTNGKKSRTNKINETETNKKRRKKYENKTKLIITMTHT